MEILEVTNAKVTACQRPNELILVQQNLRILPGDIVAEYGSYAEYLDLSNNRLRQLHWIFEFDHLKELILDSNGLDEAQLRPLLGGSMEQLEVLMLNKNEFSDLPTTISLIKEIFPNLLYLSLHGNPICPDGLELKPFAEYVSYDYNYYSTYIANALHKLKFLDHGVVERVYKYETFDDVHKTKCQEITRNASTELRRQKWNKFDYNNYNSNGNRFITTTNL